MKAIFALTDGQGLGGEWRELRPGNELQEGRLELGGELRRVYRLPTPWAEIAKMPIELLHVPDDVDPRQLLELEGVSRVLSAAAVRARAVKEELVWPTEQVELEQGGTVVYQRGLPGIAGGSAPDALEGEGKAAAVELHLVDGEVTAIAADVAGVELPDVDDQVEPKEVAVERVP